MTRVDCHLEVCAKINPVSPKLISYQGVFFITVVGKTIRAGGQVGGARLGADPGFMLGDRDGVHGVHGCILWSGQRMSASLFT